MNIKFFKKKSFSIALFIIFSVLISLNLINSYSILYNTLDNNSNWISSKYDLGKPIIGGGEYIWETQALSKKHLDLSAWYGYNQVFTKENFSPSKIEFDFLLDKGQFFYFVFNKNSEFSSMLRFSNSNDFPAAHLSVKESGEFSLYEQIDLKNYATKKWHHVTINQVNNSLLVKVDNNQEIIINNKFLDNSQIGFRGSQYKVLIDNVLIKDINQKILLNENFSHKHKNLLLTISLITALIFIIQFILFLFININKIKIFIINSIFIIIVIFLNIFLVQVITPSYKRNSSIVNNTRLFLNKFDGNIFLETQYPSIYLFKNLFENYIPENKEKIFFIGTSQTWGAGAQKISDSLVNIFDSKLKSDPINNKYQIINTSIPGSKSDELLFYYKNYWLKTPPKIVIINLSNNDLDYDSFYNNIFNFVKINKENNIKTIFVLEANSIEDDPNFLVSYDLNYGSKNTSNNYKAIKEIAKSEGLQIVDLNNFLISKKDSGIIWWDYVHMTNFGQKIAAEYLYNEIKNEL